MTSLSLLNFTVVLLIAAIGSAAGWWAQRYWARRQEQHSDDDRRLTQDVLTKVLALVDHVSAEMGEHGDYLAEVNESLAVAVTDETKMVAASLAKLLVANSKMRERLTLAESRLREQSHAIESHAGESRIDSLTRLVNRRAFDDEVRRAFAAYRRQGRVFSIVLLDLDHLTQWNDRFGHPSGNRLLARVAAMVRDNAREMDLGASAGGGRFAILLPGTALADAVMVAQRIRGAVARSEGEEASMTLSGGAAQVRSEDSVRTLIARADAALAAAKSAGRNNVHFHDGSAIQPSTPADAAAPEASSTEPPAGAVSKVKAASSKTTSKDQGAPPSTSAQAARPGAVSAQTCVEEPPYLCARTEFRTTVARRLAEWRRGGSPLSVALVRVDDYWSTIEEYGFEIEPCIRSALWNLVVATTRDMDLVGLYDQETFAMLLPTADRFTASGVAERLREAVIQRSLTTPRGLFQFAVSSGVAEARDGDNPDQLLQRAEDALLAAVASGGNRTFVDDSGGPRACPSEAEVVDSCP